MTGGSGGNPWRILSYGDLRILFGEGAPAKTPFSDRLYKQLMCVMHLLPCWNELNRAKSPYGIVLDRTPIENHRP